MDFRPLIKTFHPRLENRYERSYSYRTIHLDRRSHTFDSGSAGNPGEAILVFRVIAITKTNICHLIDVSKPIIGFVSYGFIFRNAKKVTIPYLSGRSTSGAHSSAAVQPSISSSGVYESGPDSISNHPGDPSYAQFLLYKLAVKVNCLLGEIEPGGDLFVAEIVGEVAEHLDLPSRKRIQFHAASSVTNPNPYMR